MQYFKGLFLKASNQNQQFQKPPPQTQPVQQFQQQYPLNQGVKQEKKKRSSGVSMEDLRRQQQLEVEKAETKMRIDALEKEKRQQTLQFDRLKEGLREENMNMKEQAAKNKALVQTATKQASDLEQQKGQQIKEIKTLRSDNQILQQQITDLQKKLFEYEAGSKVYNQRILDREDRTKWNENRLKEEQQKHQQTQKITQLEQEIQFQVKDRERLTHQIEEIHLNSHKKFNELHDVKLSQERELNHLQLKLDEMRRDMNQQNSAIRNMELERERLITRLQDYERMTVKLQARDRQIVELEIELERVTKEKIQNPQIIERFIEVEPQPVPPDDREMIEPYRIPSYPSDIIQLHEDLLYMTNDRERLMDELEYWRNRLISNITKSRYSELEEAGDRAVNLLAHQNRFGEEYHNDDVAKYKKILSTIKTRVLSLINDLNILKRNSKNKEMIDAITSTLQKHSDLVRVLAEY